MAEPPQEEEEERHLLRRFTSEAADVADSPADLAALIRRATSHPFLFSFASFLSSPSLAQVRRSPSPLPFPFPFFRVRVSLFDFLTVPAVGWLSLLWRSLMVPSTLRLWTCSGCLLMGLGVITSVCLGL